MPDEAALYQIIGFAGFLAYMASFAGLQFGLMRGDSATFAWCNIIGAALVLISLTHAFNLASALIQISWIIIGLGGLARRSYLAARQSAGTGACALD